MLKPIWIISTEDVIIERSMVAPANIIKRFHGLLVLLVTPSFFYQTLSVACEDLLDPKNSQQQLLDAAKVIAENVHMVCNACKTASTKTTDPTAEKKFLQAANDVANSTASLIKDIKVCCIVAKEPLARSLSSYPLYYYALIGPSW